MDTYVTVIIYHNDEDEAKDIIDDAFTRMEEIISIADRFNASSEVTELNTNGVVNDPSPELVEMIQISVEYWAITDGAFDITILPLLDLWNPSSGAGPYLLFNLSLSPSEALDSGTVTETLRTDFSNYQYVLNETPQVTVIEEGRLWTIQSGWVHYRITNSSTELAVTVQEFWNVNPARQNEYINETKKFVGSDKITISEDSITLQTGMSITLDGMAKGYIVDSAIKLLEEKGVERALIDAGGDIATLGNKPEGEKWTIGLRNPEDKSDSIMEFEISGKAIATSGNYERFFDENKSVGHIMDPSTGNSVFKASSATIIADNCTVADILATGIFVLGPEEGIQLVDTLPGVEALMLGYDDPQELFPSSGVDKYEK
jgi:thiamine biosynthesis lipoprotein